MATATDPGPFSALFNYDEELKKEQELAQQRQKAQQKIMRTNAVGDALGLLIDSVGGSAGATINQRGPNPYLQKASSKYNELLDQQKSDEDRLRLQDLAMRDKDLQRSLGKEDLAEGRKYSEGQLADQRNWTEKQKADERAYNEKQQEVNFGRQKELGQISAANARDLAKFNTNENIREKSATLKMQQDMKSAINRDRSKPVDADDVLFQIPGTTTKIYVGSEEIAEMAHRLISDIEKEGGFVMDPTLNAFKRNELVKPTSLVEVIKSNWDKVKYVLPEYAGQQPEEPSPLQKRTDQYTNELQKLQDSDLSDRKRKRRLEDLNEEYKDVIEAKKKAFIPSDDKGVTDVSSIFN